MSKFKKISYSKEKMSNWIFYIKTFSIREAKETKIAGKILVKILKKELGVSKSKPTQEEILFIKKHSKDLAKLVAFVITRPTPIPYILIVVILRKFNINLLPSKDSLKIPKNYIK